MRSTPLWRNRDFMLFQSGQLLSTFGSSISNIAYPLLALAVTNSAVKAGAIGAIELVPLVFFNFPAGMAADRFDRRRMMIVADVVGALSVGALAAALLAGHVAYWTICVVAFLDTAAAIFFRAGAGGAFKAVVPQEQLADAASVTMARASVTRLAAPPVGGALFAVSRGIPFLADAISYAFSTASLLVMRTPFQEAREPGTRAHLREGVAYFWSIPFLRTTIGMIAASNIVAAGAPMAVIILAHRHGISSTGIGAFIALQGATLLAGSMLSPLLRRLFPMRAILLSEFWTGWIYVAYLIYPNVYVLAACSALHAFWFPNTDSAMTAYSYVLIPDRLLGRAMAASNTLRACTAPLGPLLAGLLLAQTTPRLTVIVLAAPVCIAAIGGALSAAIRDLPSLGASPAEAR